MVCHEVPYPPTHGGRVETWNRIVGWTRLGISLQVVYWVPMPEDGAGARQAMGRLGISVIELTRRHHLRQLFDLRYPPIMFSLQFERYATVRERVRDFRPDWVLLDGWPGFFLARRLTGDLDRPLVYRSQNAEHFYWAELVRATRGFGRVRLWLTASRIRRVERQIRTGAALVLDATSEDAAICRSAGFEGKSVVLPPFWPLPALPAEVRSPDEAGADVLYGGNLWAPNNVEGLEWFSHEVLPALRQAAGRSDRVVFAGSRPARAVLDLCRRNNIRCVENPVQLSTWFVHARVLINPVQRTSGINIKMLEMLATDRPIIATTAAVRGLPKELRREVIVADDSAAFAAAVAAALSEGIPVDAARRRSLIEAEFGLERHRTFFEKQRDL
jgi:glycosyltransferase involved in cell wall biosynthesis